MSRVSKALSNVTGYARRWADRMAKRTNRIYDDRDNSLADAIKLLEEKSTSYYPAIYHIDEALNALSVGGSALTGITVSGTNLVGDMEKAAGSTADNAGQLTFTAIFPGEQTITVTIVDDGGSADVTADAAAGTIGIDIGDGGGAGTAGDYTTAEIKAAIEAHAEAKFMVAVTIDTAGDIDTGEVVTVETSTIDPGTIPTVTLGDQTLSGADAGFGFTAWTDTALTMDIDPTGLTAGEMHMLKFWIDDVLVAEIPCFTVA
jgi:hypothetical protein